MSDTPKTTTLIDGKIAHDPTPSDLPQPGTYRHYKGGIYHLAWLARREHDGEWMCCYGECGTLKRFVRPAAEWSEVVNNDGTLRFTPI